jgi:deoxyribodipyrimidine photo-lyase
MDLTREAGLKRLSEFVAGPLANYASCRNLDLGNDRHTEVVSKLSPYIRMRLVLESEVIAASLTRFPAQTISKWIDEVIWRTYWKGWLEQSPQVWTSYVTAIAQLEQEGWRERVNYTEAISGKSGIACIDHWVRELKDTGYLHNHARMWFASIWIFTLQLPWELGADFFLRHLLDGDAAANTLSWRWVAGLHTPGKRYVASASNIERWTEGRVRVTETLATEAEAFKRAPQDADYKPTAESILELNSAFNSDPRRTLLIHPEDLAIEYSSLATEDFDAIVVLDCSKTVLATFFSDAIMHAHRQALEDCIHRTETHFGTQVFRLSPDEVNPFAQDQGSHSWVCIKPVVGIWQDAWRPYFAKQSIEFVQREWDQILYPFARKGFFQFKKSAWDTDLVLQKT